MSEEGEFKKRIVSLIFAEWMTMGVLKEEDGGKIETLLTFKKAVSKQTILTFIDEAKKEFPKVLPLNEMKKRYDAVDWVDAVEKWFVKWFGVQEKE